MHAYTCFCRFYGGHVRFFEKDDWKSWEPTIANNPWLFDGRLEPITSLVQEPDRREAVRAAVQMYMDRTYLLQLKRNIHSALQVTQSGKARKALRRTIGFIKQTLQKVTIDHSMVENLVEGDDVPEWFLNHTTLCMEWFPVGEKSRNKRLMPVTAPIGGVGIAPSAFIFSSALRELIARLVGDRPCGAGNTRHLCAPPDTMTPEYRDNTNGMNVGKCMMSWAIENNHAPAWFHAVRLCFRWRPELPVQPWSGQCGDGSDGQTVCTNVNQYLPFYRDGTDDNAGGCQLSWMLEVPEIAGQWMNKVRLCLHWYPEDDVSQCSASQRELCAKANEWTPYYLDNTNTKRNWVYAFILCEDNKDLFRCSPSD